jgi:hypothetical protein
MGKPAEQSYHSELGRRPINELADHEASLERKVIELAQRGVRDAATLTK